MDHEIIEHRDGVESRTWSRGRFEGRHSRASAAYADPESIFARALHPSPARRNDPSII